jgi:hypothetical protein
MSKKNLSLSNEEVIFYLYLSMTIPFQMFETGLNNLDFAFVNLNSKSIKHSFKIISRKSLEELSKIKIGANAEKRHVVWKKIRSHSPQI